MANTEVLQIFRKYLVIEFSQMLSIFENIFNWIVSAYKEKNDISSEKSSYNGEIILIGAGLGRTGTMSTKKALEILCNAPCYHMTEVKNHVEWIEIIRGNKTANYDKILHGYAFTSDYPACLQYLNILKQYPNAKVLLTVRDPKNWYNSLKQTIGRMAPAFGLQDFGLKVLRYVPPFSLLMKLSNVCLFEITFQRKEFTLENAIEAFNNHTNAVKANVPSEKLLIFDVKEGWEPLCKFVGKDIPNVPFPNVNDSKELKVLFDRISMGGTGLFVTASAVLVGLFSYTIKKFIY